MSIKLKLNLLGGLIAVAMLVMTLFQHYAMNAIKKVDEGHLLISQVETGMLTLRRNEKDFLARKDLKYTQHFTQNFKALQQQVNDLKVKLKDLNIGAQWSEQLSLALNTYKVHFDSVVTFQRKIGLHPKDGLYGKLRQSVHEIEGELKKLSANNLLKDMLMLRRREKDFMLRMDLKYVSKLDKDITVLLQDLADNNTFSFDTKQLIKAKLKLYNSAFHALVEAEKEKGLTAKDGYMGMMRQSVHKTEGVITEAKQVLGAEVEAKSEWLSNLSLIISGIIIILTLIATILLGRNISLPINLLAKLMSQARDNKDLSLRFQAEGNDEIALMGKNFNEMVCEFQNTVESVLKSSTNVSSAAEELSIITKQTTNSVIRQHSESDQIATAMNEMAATAQEVSQHASEAANASKIADDEAAKGRNIVSEAVNGIKTLAQEVRNTSNAIHTLEQESENIGTVLTVIQSIAEQTNLLALNAAIEAARAGESGRGFAVVADEVRKLAQRSQDATKEIKVIIERLQNGAHKAVQAMDIGQDQANTSVAQAEAAGQSLEAITQAVTAINDMNLQIANAAAEQTSVAEEINRNIVNITQISNETADAAHQTTATSSNLAHLAVELQTLISQFNLDDSSQSFDISKAKAAHFAWKTRLRSYLDGERSMTLNEAVSHKHCILGKWYYSEGLAKFGHIDEMKQLEVPHEELHKLIKEVINAKELGDIQKAESAYEKIPPLSTQIIDLLSAVERKLN